MRSGRWQNTGMLHKAAKSSKPAAFEFPNAFVGFGVNVQRYSLSSIHNTSTLTSVRNNAALNLYVTSCNFMRNTAEV